MEKIEKPEVIVTEGVEGTWHYHLSKPDHHIRSLCQKYTMICNLSFEKWGTVTDLKEKYCEKCMEIYQREKKAKGK